MLALFHALGQLIHPLYQALAILLAFWYGLVPSYAVAIALFTVTVMVVLAPLTIKSTRSMLAMQRLQPEVKKIQAKYKGDKMAQQEELSALFKEHNVSPAGGCLPMIIQLPVFWVLYEVIQGLTYVHNGVAQPKYISHTTLLYHNLVAAHGHMFSVGIDLARTAFNVPGGFVAALPFYGILVACIALQYVQMRQLTNRNPQASQANPQMAKIQKYTPLIFGVIYISIPAGVNVYFLVSSLFRIGQQELMYRYDPQLKAHLSSSKGHGEVVETVERPSGDGEEDKAGPTRPAGGLLANLRAARGELRASNGASGQAGSPGRLRPTAALGRSGSAQAGSEIREPGRRQPKSGGDGSTWKRPAPGGAGARRPSSVRSPAGVEVSDGPAARSRGAGAGAAGASAARRVAPSQDRGRRQGGSGSEGRATRGASSGNRRTVAGNGNGNGNGTGNGTGNGNGTGTGSTPVRSGARNGSSSAREGPGAGGKGNGAQAERVPAGKGLAAGASRSGRGSSKAGGNGARGDGPKPPSGPQPRSRSKRPRRPR
ncbi:MAG: membrane protein insertase YidC [Acidimicrobiales bacterium]